MECSSASFGGYENRIEKIRTNIVQLTLVLNDYLKEINKKETDLCYFWNNNLFHFFCNCSVVQPFWETVASGDM